HPPSSLSEPAGLKRRNLSGPFDSAELPVGLSVRVDLSAVLFIILILMWSYSSSAFPRSAFQAGNLQAFPAVECRKTLGAACHFTFPWIQLRQLWKVADTGADQPCS